MKRMLVMLLALAVCLPAGAQSSQTIKLLPPSKTGGKDIMESLWSRRSTREFADKKLSAQELADLLWAANGVSREDGKRTAPSAKNLQDVEVYVCFDDGSYRYDAPSHTLVFLSAGDARPMKAPLCLVLVSDAKGNYPATDCGIVAENISLFCAGWDLATVIRGSGMDPAALATALNLPDGRKPYLNMPVGHFKK